MDADRLAIHAVSTRKDDPPALIEAYAGAGFGNVEFELGAVRDYLSEGHDVTDLRATLEEHGMRCIGGHERRLRCFTDDPVSDNRAIIENAGLLSDLGAETMVVGTDAPDAERDPGAVIERCAEAFAAVADRVDLTVCLEFNWSPVIRSLRSAVLASRRAGHANVGVLFDPAHYHCTPTKLEDITPETVAEVAHVHVNDMREYPGDLSDCNDDRRLPGEGHLPLEEIFGRLEAGGYDGYYSVEMFDDGLRSLPPGEAAGRIYESMEPFLG